jgi:hypothetical protein
MDAIPEAKIKILLDREPGKTHAGAVRAMIGLGRASTKA